MKKILFLLFFMPLLGISQAKFGGNSVAAARASLKNSSTYTLTYVDGIFYLVSTTTSYPIAFSTVGSTGTGNLVYATSPTLVTPNLGTPSAVTLTNGTGLPVSTGISGLGTGVATFLSTPTSENLASTITNSVFYGKGTGNVAGNTVIGNSVFTIGTAGTYNTIGGFEAAKKMKNLSEGGLFNAQGNTVFGAQAMSGDTARGDYNIAIGYLSMYNATKPYSCVGIGIRTLYSNQTGIYNTAIGTDALKTNTVSNNTALGAKALLYNTTGTPNTAVGIASLENNTTGNDNTGLGANTLQGNITGIRNTAVGSQSLLVNTASSNTAVGFRSLTANTSGTLNVAVGQDALQTNITGSSLTAIGFEALRDATVGNSTALGFRSLRVATGGGNTAVGYQAGSALTSGQYNLYLGGHTGVGFETSSQRIVISDGLANIRMFIDNNGNTGIGTTSPSGILHAASTTSFALLCPMTTTQRNALTGLVAGAEIYCSDCTATDASTGVKQVYNGSAWKNCW